MRGMWKTLALAGDISLQWMKDSKVFASSPEAIAYDCHVELRHVVRFSVGSDRKCKRLVAMRLPQLPAGLAPISYTFRCCYKLLHTTRS